MFNPDSSLPGKSLSISDLFLNAKWRCAEEGKSSAMFTPEHFAKDWDSIYVHPDQLPQKDVKEGMRKLVSPTLLITSKGARMAYVIASEKAPIYIPNEYVKDDQFGYLMAFRLGLSFITPEYVFYLCEYDYWNKYLSFWAEGGDRFDMVGPTGDYDLERQTYLEFTAEMLVSHLGNTVVPTLEGQKRLVNEAKEADEKIKQLSSVSEKELSNIIWKYLQLSRTGIFSHSQARIGLLRELYRQAAGQSIKKDVLKALPDDLYPFNADAICESDFNVLSKNFARVFPLLVNPSEFSWDKEPEYLQPKEVTDFIVKLANITSGLTVYNPFSGLASYAVALPDNYVEGEEINMTTWAVAQIRIFATGANAHIVNEDSFKALESNKEYDVIVTSPPYLKERGRRINDIIEKLYDKLTDNGKLICLVSHNLLSAPAYEKLREKLISDKSLKAVITLPNNIFPGTGIQQDVLFIQKGSLGDTIIMGDASYATRYAKSTYRMTTFEWEQFIQDLEDEIEDYYDRGCTIDDSTIGAPIKYQDIIGSILTPSIYLTPKPSDGVLLSTLADTIRETRTDGGAEYYILASAIPEAMHRQPFVPEKVNEEHIAPNKSQVSISGDAVIVGMVSGKIRTVYLENFYGKIAFPNGFVKALKPAPGVSAKYLAALLSTKIVTDQIKAQSARLTIPRLHGLDLSQIYVPDYKTVVDKEKLISEVLSSEMSELESELHETLARQKREIRSTRHAMIQTLSALSSNWGQLKRFAERKNGHINLSDTIGRINPITVELLMGSIGYAISTLERQVESLRFEKADWGQEVEINPYKFINDYIASHSTPDVRMVNLGDNKTGLFYFNFDEDGKVSDAYHENEAMAFYAPERLVERIFNNIVANAKAHGFSPDSTNNEIRFDWQNVNGNIVITIANNGAPLKDGVTSDDVLMSGFSTALNENAADGTLHSGQGGFEIKSLMENLGKVEVVSEPDSEYPVIYKLTFEKTNFVTLHE